MRCTPLARFAAAAMPFCFLLTAPAQREQHGRGYKPPSPTATVVITVQKAANGKPMPSTSVIFRAVRDRKDDGNLEMKTDGDGRASIDLLEVGSHVTVQVLAPGFASYASDFDLTAQGKELQVKLERPRAQISQYGDARDQPADIQPGIQEHHAAKPVAPTTAVPAPGSPTAPLQTTPPANTPATAPVTGTPVTPNAAGSPQ